MIYSLLSSSSSSISFSRLISSLHLIYILTLPRLSTGILNNSGKSFDLHYTEYLGSLPWRGNSKYLVDSILSMGGVGNSKVIDPKAGDR